VLVVTAAAVWIAVSIAVGFPARWETIFQTVVAALTLTMVFVIQHTQARHQRATQRKLDEILLAMPGTDNSLLRLEHASDDELRAAGTSIGRSVKPHWMAIPGLAQPTQRKKTRLSVLPNVGPDRFARRPRAARPG
jgi:low affinity Fe/Cu permease